MKETTHTPGPWQSLNGGPFITTCIDKEGEFVICVTSNIASHVQFAAKVASLEDKANARLIASAPELLEALRYYVSLHEANILSMPEVNENEGKAWKRTLAIAKEAIAKATGGDQS